MKPFLKWAAQVHDPFEENVLPTEEITWTRVHVTFQSTSSTNISTVNAINENQLFVRKKEQGRGEGKMHWAIKMNEACQLYLATYGRVDTIDSLINCCNLYYCSWKYWHSCKLHVHALGLVAAYDMYKEVVLEGWASFGFASKKEAAKKCHLDFHTFRDRLSFQGLRYQPEECKYPGDRQMRVNTKRGRGSAPKQGEKRARGRPRKTVTPNGAEDVAVVVGKVTLAQLDEAKGPNGRICGDLTEFLLHKTSLVPVKFSLTCKWCGQGAYTKCGICNMPCHDDPKKGACEGLQCFTHLHNEHRFGLAMTDCKLVKKKQSDWLEPTPEELVENLRHVQKISQTPVLRNRRGRLPTVEDSI